MKKSYSFLMAAALVAGSLASCTVNDDIQTKSDNQGLKEIKFSSGDITRGPVFTGTTAPDNMLVYAFQNNDAKTKHIDGATFTKGDDNKYTCTTTYYWPNGTETGDQLNFLALYPTSVTSAEGFVAPSEASVFTYKASTTIGSQVDLMGALAEGKTKSSDDVEMAFKHLLSQIVFTGYVESAANLKVTVSGISLCNIKTTGTSSREDDALKLTASDAKDTYAVTFTGKELSTNADSPTELTTTAENALLLVPQTGTAWNPSSNIEANNSSDKNVYLQVKVTAQNKTNNDYVLGTSSEAATVYFPLAPNWTAAKKYTYKLHFGKKDDATDGLGRKDTGEKETINATAITLTASVTDWTDAETEEITF